MADPKNADAYVLKILSGVQSGVEALLAAGEYTLGSGPDDDIQLIDLSLKPGHVRLRLSPGAIEVRGLAGTLRTSAGLLVGAESDWHAIAPLDVVTAGTTRFALGAPTAQWATLADVDPAGVAAGQPRQPPQSPERPRRRLFWNVAAVLCVAGAALWFGLQGREVASGTRFAARDDLALTREALAPLPFASRLRVNKEVDGAIFVTGHVDTPVQRRAVLGALEQVGSPARPRIWVVEALRADLEALIQSERLSLAAQIGPDGSATLDGLVLSDATARRFVSLVQNQVLGLTRVENRIRTAETLLGQVRDLARLSQIASFVIFRLDGELIEATGLLPTDRVDAWVGFLQAFAQRHASEIGLRSFVQLQTAAGQRPDRAIGIGRGADGVTLDADRLRQGLYGPQELFPPTAAEPAPAPSPPAPSAPATVSPVRSGVSDLIDQLRRDGDPPQAAPQAGLRPPEGPRAGSLRVAPAGPVLNRAPDTNEEATNAARALIERWRDGALGDSPLRGAMDALGAAERGGASLNEAERRAVAERLLPIFADPRRATGGDACWPGSRLTRANLATALFWLDLAAVSEQVTVRSLALDMQGLVLEAALNPRRVADCARGGAERARRDSIYLAETLRNPAFVRYIARDLPGFQLDVAGANLRAARFIQTRAGEKIFEGGAPDQGSRLALVGELGAAVQQRGGLSVVVFGRELNWFVLD